ncbi:hypothetical protein BKA69DRAFT_208926 [Paraphysoderma sedebokerense]|nr:hypothetical protein BKA69DRAFT_208926 [Paraphysoderma sedebokerense]
MAKDIKFMLHILCGNSSLLILCAIVAASYANLSKLTSAPGTLVMVYRLYLAVNSYCYLGITKFGVSGDSTIEVTSNRVAVVYERRIDA